MGMVRADSLYHPLCKQYLKKEKEAKESWSGWWAVPYIFWSKDIGLFHKSPYGDMKQIQNPLELKDTCSIILPGLESFLCHWKVKSIKNKFTGEVIIEIVDTVMTGELLKIINTCGQTEFSTIDFIHGDKFIEYLPPAEVPGDTSRILKLKMTEDQKRNMKMRRDSIMR